MLKETYNTSPLVKELKKIKENNPNFKLNFEDVAPTHFSPLHPSKELEREYVDHIISRETFVAKFREEMNKRNCHEEMLRIAKKAAKEDVYILCYHKEEHKCHRFVLMDLIGEIAKANDIHLQIEKKQQYLSNSENELEEEPLQPLSNNTNDKKISKLELISDDITPIDFQSTILELAHLPEGAKKTIYVNTYERNQQAKKICIEHYGTVCQICGFDFKEKYGKIGEGFIEAHHRIPLSEIGKSYELDPINDLILVCSNCHSMLHRTRDKTLEVDELKEMIENKNLSR